MLLSNIIKLSRHLNESFKSSFLKELNNLFENSSYCKTPKRIDYNIWRDQDDVDFSYRNLAREGILTQQMCDDPKERRRILNTVYKSNKFNILKYIHDRYSSHSTYNKEYKLMNYKEKAKFVLDYSQVQDQDFEDIELKDSRKKIHNNKLMFWMGYTDNLYTETGEYDYTKELKAVTFNNEILFIVNKVSYYYDVNDNYTGPTEITPGFSSYSNSDLHNFIKKAFKKIPVLEIVNTTKEIREILGSTSILSLQKWNVTNIKAIKVNDEEYINKMQSREDWQTFINELNYIAKENIKRYKNIIMKNSSIKQFTDAKLCLDELFNYYVETIITKNSELEKILLSSTEGHYDRYKRPVLGTTYVSKNRSYNTYIITYAQGLQVLMEHINTIINLIITTKQNIADIEKLSRNVNNEETTKELTDALVDYKYNIKSVVNKIHDRYSKYINIIKYSNGFIPDYFEEMEKICKKYGY